MIPREIAAYLPYAALGGAVLAFVLVLLFGVRRARIQRRPLLLLALLLGALPAFYVTLVWARLAPEAYVRFARPLLAPLVFAAVAFVALRLALHPVRWSRFRVVLADFTMAVAVLASAIAAMGPELGRPLDRLAIVVVVDRSRSIDLVPHAEQRVARELTVAEESMHDDDFLGTVVFASDAATEQPLRQKGTAPSVQRVDIGRDGTDIAAGLRRALAEVPADAAARIVLMSDGVPTRGDVMSAAAAAVASEIPVDTVVLEQRSIADVRVVTFRVTPRATEGETIGMRIVTSSPKEAEVEVRIKQNGKLLTRSRAKIAAGEDVLVLRDKAPESGLHRYDVEVTAIDKSLDETAEDNSASAFVRVTGPARALVLDGDKGKTTFIAGALTGGGFRVEEGTHSAVPADIDGMAGYDLIVMGDIPAHNLSTRQIAALASYVRDLGGGLVLTGGDRSMGPGGYSRTPIEDVSPLSFDLKQERRRASLAEVIAIDISGSMAMSVGKLTKLDLANEAAARSAALLGPGDHLGVVHVDTEAHWSLPLQPVKDKDAIEKAIRNVGPGGGGILCDVALQEAYRSLRGASVNLKHVLLFADGADAENITPAVKGWTSAAMSDGITTSVVALGQGPFLTDLEDLSRRGSGRFYIVEDATRLPAVFAQETVLASRSAIVEKTFKVSTGSSGAITQGIDFSTAPPLDGYVVTIPKSRSSVLLTGLEGDPVLAVWPAGLGRAAAFTSDLKDRWGGAWTEWQGAARMVAQMARDVARSEDDRRVRLEADASGGQLHLRATVVDDDGRLQSFRRLRVGVQGPDGFTRDVPLEAAGAGSYTASVPLARPGAYIAVARDEMSGDAVATTGAALTAGEEM
ncbi:MAG TPA: VWA domain-containing protein, partial [Polyangiaceae bacterium]|nr:VWA domain-containing protein [Polyangiaceae bacterium]